jgi:hypothetical protein
MLFVNAIAVRHMIASQSLAFDGYLTGENVVRRIVGGGSGLNNPKSLFAPQAKRMMECRMSFKSRRDKNKSHPANKCAHMVIAQSNPFCWRSKQRLSLQIRPTSGPSKLTTNHHLRRAHGVSRAGAVNATIARMSEAIQRTGITNRTADAVGSPEAWWIDRHSQGSLST